MIRAEELDQLVRIETPSKAANGVGEEVLTWMFDADIWAKAVERRGREFLQGDFQAERKVAFKMRYREIDSEARVTWDGQIFNIVSVTGTFRSGETWLHCVASAGAS